MAQFLTGLGDAGQRVRLVFSKRSQRAAVEDGGLDRLPVSGLRRFVDGVERRAGCRPDLVRRDELSRDDRKRTKPIIGLVGGVGAGKSTVARILESLGAAVIDSDHLGHEVLDEPSVIATLTDWWGESICGADGGVDRSVVAQVVFNDPGELARLERLLYPRIAQRRGSLTAAYEADPDVRAIVLDAPKLYEAGLSELCDAIIFVETQRSVRLARLAASRGWTEAELLRREKLQAPLDNKRVIADHIVANHSDISAVRLRIEQVFASALASFSQSV